MNTHQSLLLDRLPEWLAAENGIPKLRELILQLAVQGKLVEQEVDDEPAAELLKRVKAEKKKLMNEGKIRKAEDLPPVKEEEKPFALPKNWEWVRLADVCLFSNYGFTASAEFGIKQIKFLRITDIQDNRVDWNTVPGCAISKTELENYLLEKNDILIARTGGTVGKSFLLENVEEKAVFASYLIRFRPSCFMSSNFVKQFLESPLYWKDARSSLTGTGQPNINASSLSILRFPLPPLAEQHRIVAKVNALMALCDELEALNKKTDHLEQSLAASTLTHLAEAKDAKAADQLLTLLAAHFEALFCKPENVDKLKSTVLQLAVQGKLMEQDAKDEPAAELLKRIKAEKKKLLSEGKIRKAEDLPPVKEEEKPFALPKGWEWVRLGMVVNVRDGERRPLSEAQRVLIKGPYDYYGASGIIDSINAFIYDEPLLLLGEDGANLINRSTPIAFIARGKYWVNNHAHVLDCFGYLFLEYLGNFLNAINYEKYVTGTAQPKLNQARMAKIPVAIPPLAEQHRIVAKVNALMALCDELVAQAKSFQDIRNALMTSLAAHLAPVADWTPSQKSWKNTSLEKQEPPGKPKTRAIVEQIPVFVKQAAVNSKGRAAFGCYVLNVLRDDKFLHRTKMEKIEHLAEYHCGLDLGRNPVRDAHGPVDIASRRDAEKLAGFQKWYFTQEHPGEKVDYKPGPEMAKALDIAEKFMGAKRATVNTLLSLMRPLNTEQCEIIATLYASWNDFLLSGKNPADDEIVHDARYNWHPEKQKIPEQEWNVWLKWMRAKELVPKGAGRIVRHKTGV